MKKSEVVLMALSSFFFGVIIGFLITPVKKGIEIGNNSGNTTYNGYDEEEVKKTKG